MNAQQIFQYCPVCKTELKKPETNLVVCPTGDFSYYFNPSPCNGIILKNSQGEVLLVKRKFEPQKGCWDFTGGFIDQDENLEESAIREAKEELGVDIENVRYLKSYSDIYSFKGILYYTLGFVVEANMIDQKIIPSDDAEEAKFFKKEDIPYDNIAFESVKRALKDYFK